MSRDTPTQIPPPHPTDAALHALDATRDASAATLAVVERLEAIFERTQTPARLIIATLDATNPVFQERERDRETTRSLGILNPNSVSVFIGGAWGSAMRSGPGGSVNTRVPSAAPNSLLVLPLPLVDLELAADPTALGANTAVVFAWRYEAVQAAYLGRIV